MTQGEFDKMPLLMRPSQARAVLGLLNRKSLAALRESLPEVAVRLPGGKEWRYRKSEIAKLCRVELQYAMEEATVVRLMEMIERLRVSVERKVGK